MSLLFWLLLRSLAFFSIGLTSSLVPVLFGSLLLFLINFDLSFPVRKLFVLKNASIIGCSHAPWSVGTPKQKKWSLLELPSNYSSWNCYWIWTVSLLKYAYFRSLLLNSLLERFLSYFGPLPLHTLAPFPGLNYFGILSCWKVCLILWN